MATFKELPVWTGNGNFHVNYFRVYIRPKPGSALPTGNDLLAGMPGFMDFHSAIVWKDGHVWRGRPTLTFRGKAVVRPFAVVPVGGGFVPVPLPDRLEKLGIPAHIREMMVPQRHTDSVCVPEAPRAHSWVAQTLKREFPTDDDLWVRRLVGQRLVSTDRNWIEKAADIARDALAIVSPAEAAHELVARMLGDHAVTVNQHHFLAGRRSFLIGTVGQLGPRPAGRSDVRDDDWVFETAAVERYSLWQYRYLTDIVMGGAPRAVKPVWVQMTQKLAAQYGTPLGATILDQREFATYADAAQSDVFRMINTNRHVSLVP